MTFYAIKIIKFDIDKAGFHPVKGNLYMDVEKKKGYGQTRYSLLKNCIALKLLFSKVVYSRFTGFTESSIFFHKNVKVFQNVTILP